MKRKEDIVIEEEKKVCPQCNQEISDDEVDCPKCGAILKESEITKTSNENCEETVDGMDVKVVNNRLVDKDGFAITENQITDESEKSELFVTVDKMREDYLKTAKKSKYVSYGVMIPVLVAMLVLLIFLTQEGTEDWVKGLLIGIVVVVLVGLFVFRFILRKKLDEKVKDYVTNYYKTTISYMFNGEEFSNLAIDPKGKVEKEFFVNARLYNGVQNVGSRNVCKFDHNGRTFTFVEMAASVQGVKKLEPIFVGKVLKYTMKNEVNGRMVGQVLGGNKLSKIIDDHEGLEQVYNSSNSSFYSNMQKEKNLLTKSIHDLFSKYKLGNDLLDVIISVNGKEIVIGLDYNDPVMQLPVEKKFDKKLVDDIQHAVLISISIIEAIAEKLEK